MGHDDDSPNADQESASTGGTGRAQIVARRLIRPCTNRLWKTQIVGAENIPVEGPAILCPNHISFFDSVFTMVYAGRQISFVGKSEYMDSWKTKYLFPALGMIPIDRSGGSKSEGALKAAEAVLRRGELFGIYPEGTRSRDGYLYKGHTGAARLALRVGCPIIPVGIIGTREIQPPGKILPKIGLECTVKFGRPIDPTRYESRDDDHMLLREITDELMFEIRELTGQEYRNVYATKKADSLPTEQAEIRQAAAG